MFVPGSAWPLCPSSGRWRLHSRLVQPRAQGSLFPQWAQGSILLRRSGYQHFSSCLQLPIPEGKVLGKCGQEVCVCVGGSSLLPYNPHWWDGFNFCIMLLGHWLLLFQLLTWRFHMRRANPSRHECTIPLPSLHSTNCSDPRGETSLGEKCITVPTTYSRPDMAILPLGWREP